MMESTYKISEKKIANYLLQLSVVALIIFAYSYQKRPVIKKKITDISKDKNPTFSPLFFQDVSYIKIQSLHGHFNLKKTTQDGEVAWKLDGISRLPAQENKIVDLLQAFSNMQIKKVMDLNIINAEIFQIADAPINLSFTTTEKSIKNIKIGKINLNNKTAFININDNPYIYEVQFQSLPFTSLIPHSFVEKAYFTYELDLIDQVDIFSQSWRKKKKTFSLKKNGNAWTNSHNKNIASSQVESFLNDLKNIKVEAILDDSASEEITKLNKYVREPKFEVVLKTPADNEKIEISEIKKDIPFLKTRSKGHFILTSSSRKSAFIISKKNLDIFKTSEKDLGDLPVKNFIY